MHISRELWAINNGQEIWKYSLSNSRMKVSLSNFGCSMISLWVPDKNGDLGNIILGYDSIGQYLHDEWYMCSIAGRVAGRISNASFEIKGKKYNLSQNEPGTFNHLHGGYSGLNKKIFEVEQERSGSNYVLVRFLYKSPHMDEGYPGNLDAYITFELTSQDALIITYEATTDMSTHYNPTNHSYFNLSGAKIPATSHFLLLNADHYLGSDKNYIPSGELLSVEDTIYDFRTLRPINKFSSSYNECFALNRSSGTSGPNAVLHDPVSGRTMNISTSFPGIVLYTGDFIGAPFIRGQGICLETQFFPDTPNRPEFHSTILNPGEKFYHRTEYRFTAMVIFIMATITLFV